MSDNIRIAIFEDNYHFRESLYFIINGTSGFECTGAWPDCRNALMNIRESKPDLILMDIEMPGVNGIESVKLIKKEFPEVPILMQTVFKDDENIFYSILAGASGYMLKSATPEQLIRAVKEARDGGSPMSPEVARRVLHLFQRFAPSQKLSEDYSLTPREKEVLSLLVDGKSYKMIAAQCNIAYETVRVHMKKIYEKLHVQSMTEAVSKAIRDRIV